MRAKAFVLAMGLLVVAAAGADAKTQRFGRVTLIQTQDDFTDEIADSLIISHGAQGARFIIYYKEGRLRSVLRHNVATPGDEYDFNKMLKHMKVRVNKTEAMTITCFGSSKEAACYCPDDTNMAKLLSALHFADRQGAVSLTVMVEETPETRRVYDCEGVAQAIDASANLKRFLWSLLKAP